MIVTKQLILCFSLTALWCVSNPANAQEWELKKEKKGIKVWTADKEESRIKQFKAEMIIEADMENVVAILLDVDNMHTWYDRIDFAKELKRNNAFSAVYLIKFGLPWPVKDRYAVVQSEITYDKESKTATIISKNEKGYLSEYEGLVRTSMLNSGWEVQSMEHGRVRVLHYGHMDPSGNIPAWLANSSIENGPIKTLSRMVEKLPEYKGVKVKVLQD